MNSKFVKIVAARKTYKVARPEGWTIRQVVAQWQAETGLRAACANSAS